MPTYSYPIWSVQPVQIQPGLFRVIRNSFYGSGQNSWVKPPAQEDKDFMLLQNVFPGMDVLRRRWGYADFCNPAFDARRLYIYSSNATGNRNIIASSTSGVNVYNEDGTLFRSSLFSTSGFTAPARAVVSRDYAYFVTGTSNQYKWDGSAGGAITNWGITAPVGTIGVGTPAGSGSLTLASGRKYVVVYRNSTTGHVSDLGTFSASTGAITTGVQYIPLSALPVSADSQVDRKVVLATADGGDETLLYFVADLPNATTTLQDNLTEAQLVANNVYYEIDDNGLEHGCSGNAPPPQGTVPIKHKGRLVMVYGNYLYFSKSLDEVTTSTGTVAGNYEECWNPVWAIDISEQEEHPRALMTDGVTLYVGSERTIRRITGDNVLNFSKPEIVFNETGVLNQETWQRVFLEDNPVGTIFVTPDYRVIQTDFNSYQDIGAPIQDVLLTINPNAASNACAMALSDGEYDLYLLAIPTGSNTDPDTVLCYNLRTRSWAKWIPTDPVVGMVFDITVNGTTLPLFASNGTYQHLFRLGRTYSQDRVSLSAVNFTAIAQTAWLHLGSPLTRKLLNEIEVLTGDTGMTVTVEAASTQADFANPEVVIQNAPLKASPFNELKVYLASSTAKERYYRFTFTSPRQAFEVLNGYSIEYSHVNMV